MEDKSKQLASSDDESGANQAASQDGAVNESSPVDQDAAHAVEPAAPSKWRENAEAAKQANKEKFGKLKDLARGYWAKKKWTLPVTVLAVIVLLLCIPLTRYPILGTVLKKPVMVTVMDSATGQPVTAATVAADGVSTKTDNRGQATLKLKVGKHTVSITKKYYKDYNRAVFVGVMGKPTINAGPVATGRQVPVTVVDYVTGRPLENAVIKSAGSETRTDKNGKATIVLPTTKTSQPATITRDGYNVATINVLVTARVVTTNNFTLTPVGKLYFLSNQSGKIDVVKTDLDGKNRKIILAGTGKEDAYSTSLLASRDWKYLALLTKRDGQPGIYLIDASSDTVTNIDGGSVTASFSLVGWSGDTFVYQVLHSNVQSWQSGAQAIKSYDATNGKLYNLDQTQGEGTSTYDYGNTSFSTVSLLNNEVVYAKSWYSSQAPDHLAGKSSTLLSVHPDGTNKKTIKDFPVPAGVQYGYAVSTLQYEAYAVYVQVPNGLDNTNTYYAYENGTLAQKSDLTDDVWNKGYPTFLVSPSGKATFWSDIRDNKNTLFVGNSEGAAGKQIATLSAYTPYGWYTDNYLLVTKNGSELYIMPADGSKQPVKLTDYYKPQLTYRGYGGGYGG